MMVSIGKSILLMEHKINKKPSCC